MNVCCCVRCMTSCAGCHLLADLVTYAPRVRRYRALDDMSPLGLLVLDQIGSLELLDDAPVPVAEHQSSYFYDGWVALLLRDGARISKKGGVPPLRPSWLARVLWLTEAIIARFDVAVNNARGLDGLLPPIPRDAACLLPLLVPLAFLLHSDCGSAGTLLLSKPLPFC